MPAVSVGVRGCYSYRGPRPPAAVPAVPALPPGLAVRPTVTALSRLPAALAYAVGELERVHLRAEAGGDLRHADEGAKLLDAHDGAGDETVMAEWRTLVQAEKEKSNHATVRGPAGDYVHSKRWGA